MLVTRFILRSNGEFKDRVYKALVVPKVLYRGCVLLRKEVIHPLLPERIPCYDLSLVAGFTFPLSIEVRVPPTSLP